MSGKSPVQHMLIKEGFAEYFAGGVVQNAEQTIFGRSQADPAPFVAQVAALLVEMQYIVVVAGRRRCAFVGDPTQNRGDSHLQLFDAEWLGQVVISPVMKALNAVSLGAQRRHYQHRSAAAGTQAG